MKYYLAYGSNLNKQQMALRCRDSKPVCTGVLHDYRLKFRRGYLTIEPDSRSYVPVGIWEISESDERALDRYEGYPRFYGKKEILLECADGKVRKCLVYIMQPGHPMSMPSDHYFYTVLRGYMDFGLQKKPLISAYEEVKWPEDCTTVSTTVSGQKSVV